MIDHPNLFEDHLGPSFECPELQASLGATSVRISKSLHMGLVQCGVDDVLVTADKSYALQVVLCLSVDGVVTLLVKKWDFHHARGNSLFFALTCRCFSNSPTSTLPHLKCDSSWKGLYRYYYAKSFFAHLQALHQG